MSLFSPASIIFDTAGNAIAVEAGTAIPASTSGLMVTGSDGTNARFLRTATDGTIRVDPTGTTTQPISAASLPLPTGAATEATLAGVLTTTDFQARINTLGQKASAASTPIVIASDQSAVPVTDNGGSLTVDGTVSVSNFPATQDINLTQLGGNAIDLGSGIIGSATQRVVLATDQPVVPISDNAGSLTVDTSQLPGALVGGRLDANVGSWLGSTAPSVGQKAMINSIPVAISSDQTVIPVSDNGGSLTVDGTVSVSNFPSLQDVNVTQLAGGAIDLGYGAPGSATQRVILSYSQPTTTMQSAATATGNGTSLVTSGYSSATIIVSGTFVATITWEASIDGATWIGVQAIDHGTGGVMLTSESPGLFVISTPAFTHIRARISSYTSGSVTVVGATTNINSRTSHVNAMIAGTDSNSVPRQILTTTDGRLAIAAAISPPINTTPVNQQYVGDVTTTSNSFYTIPTGETIRIQRFSAGSEADATAGSKCELYYAPNGNTTGIVQIGIPIYTNGDTFELGLDYETPDVGDGTRAIMVRRQRFSGGAVEIAAFWDGYY